MRHTYILATIALLAAGCSDEIDFDYDSISPLPVIEAYVEGGGVRVSITTTRDVTDSARNHYVTDAEVLLTGPGGVEYAVPYVGDGVYSRSGVSCQEGGLYTLSVGIDGETFVATDTMAMAPQVKNARFMWEEFIGNDIVSYRYSVMTPADSLTYYVLSMKVNGKAYNWKDFSNYSAYDGLIEGRVMCFSRDDLEGKEDSSPEDVIHDGDKVEVSIAGISRRASDYYEALDLSGSTNANPAWSFSGRALGIFAARSVVRMPVITFNISEVEKE